MFTGVGEQVTLCDPIRQMTPHSSEMGFHEELYTPFNHLIVMSFFNCVHVWNWVLYCLCAAGTAVVLY